MKEYLTVHLKNVRIMMPIGVIPEEKLLKNIIIINVSVTLANKNTILDYSILYKLIHKLSQQQFDYLEEFAQSIASEIQNMTTEWSCIEIQIEKVHPPIPDFDGSAYISYKIER